MSPEAPGSHVVAFDIETRLLKNWDEMYDGKAGVSAFAVWDNRTGRHHLYDDSNLAEGVRHLESADVVLSFNGIEFDIRVLEGELKRAITLKEHLDLMKMVWRSTKSRVKGYRLDDIARRCLGYGKTGKSETAPEMARKGLWAELFDYCIMDVELTRLLFWYVQQHNGVVSVGGTLLPISTPYWFGDLDLGFVPEEVKSAVLP